MGKQAQHSSLNFHLVYQRSFWTHPALWGDGYECNKKFK